MSVELVRDAATPIDRVVADLTARVEQTAYEAFLAGFALGNQYAPIDDRERLEAFARSIWRA